MGKQIATLEHLITAAQNKQAVICPTSNAFRNRIPAAFVANLQGTIINRLIKMGLFIYTPKKEKKHYGKRK